MAFKWLQTQTFRSKDYVCGYCGRSLTSEKGYSIEGVSADAVSIRICHHCSKPTFFNRDEQTPGSIYGEDVFGIEDQGVKDLYKEARKCTKECAYTASILCCRKLLMHVAVSKGAEENKSFIEYVQYLSDKNFIPPGAKDWVDIIRDKGNEANHEIVIMGKQDAEDLLKFMEMLLKIVYEFPDKVKKIKEAPQEGA